MMHRGRRVRARVAGACCPALTCCRARRGRGAGAGRARGGRGAGAGQARGGACAPLSTAGGARAGEARRGTVRAAPRPQPHVSRAPSASAAPDGRRQAGCRRRAPAATSNTTYQDARGGAALRARHPARAQAARRAAARARAALLAAELRVGRHLAPLLHCLAGAAPRAPRAPAGQRGRQLGGHAAPRRRLPRARPLPGRLRLASGRRHFVEQRRLRELVQRARVLGPVRARDRRVPDRSAQVPHQERGGRARGVRAAAADAQSLRAPARARRGDGRYADQERPARARYRGGAAGPGCLGRGARARLRERARAQRRGAGAARGDARADRGGAAGARPVRRRHARAQPGLARRRRHARAAARAALRRRVAHVIASLIRLPPNGPSLR